MKSLFDKSSASFATRMSSEPEEKRKAPNDLKRIIRFRFGFGLFYFLVFIISLRVIVFCLESAGCLNDPFLLSCFGPHKGVRENVYGVGFSFDFHAFLSEKSEPNDNETRSIWSMHNLTYFDPNWPVFSFSTNITISEVSRARICKQFEVWIGFFLFSACETTAAFTCTSTSRRAAFLRCPQKTFRCHVRVQKIQQSTPFTRWEDWISTGTIPRSTPFAPTGDRTGRWI